MKGVHHVFVSSIVSGPETLVLPNLSRLTERPRIVILRETRETTEGGVVGDYARGLGLETSEIPVRSRFDVRTIGLLRDFWTSAPPAIVHAHGPKATLHAALARRLVGPSRPLLVTTHHGVRATDRFLKTRAYEKVYEKAIMPFCDLCLTVCTSDRELLIRRGVPGERLRVHLNGVDRRAVGAAERSALQIKVRRGWARVCGLEELDGFLIGVVGRLSVEKRHGRILSALSLLAERSPRLGFRLLCFGSGPLEKELRDLSARSAIASRVHWMGYRAGVSDELAGLDLLLSLSNAEGLPINLIEAGWAGTPVLATGVDGIRDLVEPGVSGVLVEHSADDARVAEEVERLALDPASAAAMGERLQERVRARFSGSVWLSRLLELYRDASGTRSSSPNPPTS
ncbi:MAG TPA: glycosyltransferase [Elusimicrobiota bacterium]|nr:glycosyltransferase [Elusimicrobiota bacterium]